MNRETGRESGWIPRPGSKFRCKVWTRGHSELRKGIQRVKHLIEALRTDTSYMENEDSWLTDHSHRPLKRGKSAVRSRRELGVKTDRECNCQNSPDLMRVLPSSRLRLRKLSVKREEEVDRKQSASISSLVLSPGKEVWLFGGLKGGKRQHAAQHYERHRRDVNENETVMDGKAAVLTHRGDLGEVSKARLAAVRPLRVRSNQGSLPRLPSPKSPGLRFQRAVARTAASMQREQLVGWD